MGKYFGTDGFRGEAGITLTADHAYKVGRFLGWYYNVLRERNGDNEPARIVIGKDTRRSSYMFEYSLVAGLTASGADAYLLHVTTTPSVAYIARVDDFDCGIMISASHNPYYDNGIKLIDCYGEKMPEETLLLVEDYIDGKLHVFDQDWLELPFAHREHIGCTVDYVAGRNRYMGYLISLGVYSFKGVKVGLDCANGSSWNIAKSVFDALGADTYVINNQPNGLNINNDAGSTHIEGLQKFVVEKGLDVGFAYDGDADRCLCVDEKTDIEKMLPTLNRIESWIEAIFAYVSSEAINHGVSCLIPKEDKKTLLAIHKAVEAAKEDGKTRKWGGKIPPTLKLPLRDGDIDRPDDENYQEHFFVNASSKDAPQVVDRHVQPVTDPMMVYSGCYCNVRLMPDFGGRGRRMLSPSTILSPRTPWTRMSWQPWSRKT